MKKLEQKEWVAVIVALLVIGFFFVFGQNLLSYFNNNKPMVFNSTQPNVITEDKMIGGGQVAAVGNRVTIHYTGRFVDGKVFDSSVTRGEPLQFTLGSGQVIPGLDKGLVGMREGGKRIITIPPELGYGMSDYGPIPGGSTLIFEIDLLKVE